MSTRHHKLRYTYVECSKLIHCSTAIILMQSIMTTSSNLNKNTEKVMNYERQIFDKLLYNKVLQNSTNLASPVSTIRPTFIRSFSRIRWLWTAPSASSELFLEYNIRHISKPMTAVPFTHKIQFTVYLRLNQWQQRQQTEELN